MTLVCFGLTNLPQALKDIATDNVLEVDLSYSNMDLKTLTEILLAIKDSKVRILNLSSVSALSGIGMQTLSKVLVQSNLINLIVRSNHFEDCDYHALFLALNDKQCKIKGLDISENSLNYVLCKKVSELLDNNNNKIETLLMSGCIPGDKGLSMITKSLLHPENKVVFSDLSSKFIRESTFEKYTKDFGKKPRLRLVTIIFNRMTYISQPYE